MKFDAWIFVGISVLATLIGISEGWSEKECGPHEIYKDCGTACPETCQNHGKPRPCTKNCVQGCFCEDGFVRQYFVNEGHKGRCIRLSECPKHSSCGKNETYKDCVSPCDDTCDCPNDTDKTCPAGCFCKPGFVRNKDDRCIRRSDCHVKPPHCGQNEEYQECGTVCPTTCANQNDVNRACPAICVSGCFCKKGFIREYINKTSTGPCIPPYKCPQKPPTCGKNEVYKNCPSPCDGTCDCPDNPGKICPKGCFCAPGFVRDKYGHCVCEDDCLPKCGKNEEYQECGTACPTTCDNKDHTGVACPAICVSGCFCTPPYIRQYKNATSTGPCILPEECPKKPTTCDQNEVYKNCPSPCDGTCDCPDNRGKICPKGCFCAPGFVRDKCGHCVCEDDCLPKCSKNAEYQECGTACPTTCENKDDTGVACPAICVSGCFCTPPYIRQYKNATSTGPCILPEECPKKPTTCDQNEVYKNCPSPCDGTCDCPDNRGKICPKGCFCAPGFVRDKCGHCVCEDDCLPKCSKNAEYQECGTACPTTCENKDDTGVACPAICVSGCFCTPPYIRQYKNATSTGPCILPEECPKKPTTCDQNEVYKNCPSPCDGTCDCPDNRGKICPKGCFCAPGFVRDKCGHCVCEDDCLPKCSKNAEYQECGTACPTTCENKDDTGVACPAICVSGCFCTPPYIRQYKNATSTGPCILPEECPKKPTTCDQNEVYKNCPSPCDGTCDCPDNHGKICPKGCFCAPGFVRDKYGHCVCEDDCLSKCGKNEKYQQCGTACPTTCDNKDDMGVACPAICVSGCFCTPPYIRQYKNATSTGPCIFPWECPNKPPTCGPNEVYKNWPSPCDGTCDCPNNPGKICPKGCFCAPGFVRDKHGKCVCVADCPPQCGKNEEHQTCGTACPTTCDNKDGPPSACILVCIDGCFCKPPFIREYKNATSTGPCILPSECPTKPTCGLNEIYSDWPLPCDGTCDHPASTISCPKGCFCKPGFVRDKYGHCIHVNNCPSKPSQCGYNEEYNYCGTACPVTCQNMHQTGVACPEICVPGCFCKFGFIREYKNATGTGPCIRPTDCPENCQKPGQCGQHEVYKKCGTACQETCDIKFSCIEKCVEGCFCEDGYVRDKINGKCILRSECPKIY